MVSATFVEEVFAAQSGEAFLVLITIDHPNLATPIRATSDAVTTVSNGENFIPYPFEMTLTLDDPQQPPRATLSIDNVDRVIVQTIRGIESPPSVRIDVVLSSDPDTLEITQDGFSFRNIDYDSLTVKGDLTYEDFLQEPYPADSFVPSLYPGLF